MQEGIATLSSILAGKFDPRLGKIPWRRVWQPTPVFLENPMDRGAWRATVHRVAKSGTRPKRPLAMRMET